MGERSILIEFDPEISEKLLYSLLALKNKVPQVLPELRLEVINAYSSLLITCDETIEDFYSVVSKLKSLLEEANIPNNLKPKLFHVPVCYSGIFSPDLEELSLMKSMSKEEIITLHANPFYTVYFIGFLPGFLYLGGLDEKLYSSRKEQPRLSVQKGAVGIGEKQTGIYPKNSPGGWQIIGNSPIELFDKKRNPPCQISPGDKIKFYPVSVETHQEIIKAVEAGEFILKNEVYDG